jgi:flagellar motor switch protein FliN/FliY
MAQLLMAEPLNGEAEFSDGYKDALGEVFRQFGGVAATAAKAKYGSAVEFELAIAPMPSWSPAATVGWKFSAPPAEPIVWRMQLGAEINASIEAASASRAQAAEAGASQPSAAPASGVTPSGTASGRTGSGMPENLSLLLDVTLDAHLRFGQRQMLLREILDLRAGSVVELDKRLQEPAELLVSGRVVARGEVVIVDGSYGIRITDIVQPQQRLASVRA